MTINKSLSKDVELFLLALQKMLRALRTTCGFSQANIADVLGIDRATYTNYENGKSYPDLVALMELAKIFQIPPESFLHPEEFKGLETARQRTAHKPETDPETIGGLSKAEKDLIAKFRSRAGKPAWSHDRVSRQVDSALGQFVIKKSYMGYPFLVCAIREAMSFFPERLTISEICEQVAAKEEIAVKVVSRELNRMVNCIWCHSSNPPVYSRIAGYEVLAKPLPHEFINTMADYLERTNQYNTETL